MSTWSLVGRGSTGSNLRFLFCLFVCILMPLELFWIQRARSHNDTCISLEGMVKHMCK